MLNPGEVISSSVWTCIVLEGADSTPSARLIGSSVIYGSISMQRAGTFIASTKYLLIATIGTTFGQTLSIYQEVFCRPLPTD